MNTGVPYHLNSVKIYQGARNLREETLHWALKDDEQPFIQEKPFRWVRGYHVGGKSLLWARQTQRWSDYDFEGPVRDGFAVDWPIRYKDIEPWYAHVEKFAGIAGNKDGLPELPDSEVMPGFEMSCIEQYFKESLKKNFPDRHLIQARCAHITDPQPIHTEQGRSKCQNQTMCNSGCIYGAYFSSNASTIPWALKTGNLTIRPHSVVHSIIYDDKKGKATGVKIIDGITKEMIEFYANVIFVNASALNSNAILLNSISDRFPNGLGNDSGLLGKYISWHNYRGKANANYEGFKDKKTDGRNPSNAICTAIQKCIQTGNGFFKRLCNWYCRRKRNVSSNTDMIGDQLRENLLNPELGNWYMSSWMMGECVPVEKNHVRLQ